MKDVYVVTHAESEHRLRHVVGGWSDSDLTPSGREDAGRVGAELARRGVGAGASLVASDLRRARSTAEIIAAMLELPLTLDPRLRELSFGEADGRPQEWLDARIRFPDPEVGRLDHLVCEGAETRRDLALRTTSFIEELRAGGPRTVVVVTHGFAMTFLVAAWIGLPVESAGFVDFASRPAGITHLRWGPPFWNRTVGSLDDDSHLARARD